MKRQFKLSVSRPCNQIWSDFTPTQMGGFCHSCQMEVIDFTQMTDDEIKGHFTSLASGKKVCGRLKTSQLKSTYTHKLPTTGISSYVKAAAVGLMVLASASIAMAQAPFVNDNLKTKTTIVRPPVSNVDVIAVEKQVVKGIVKDGEGEVMPGVNIVLKGTEIGTVTDINGYFEFPQKLDKGDILLFSFLGYETVAYNVPEQVNNNLEINLTMASLVMLGEIAVDGVYEEPSAIEKMWNKVKSIF
ncbi:carboxypeptidase-like regulatory domain-containing protein [Fulvivirga maritima]|uniref:carboxypeptidase-like regulatory domain-containing protein n=1 Tax=Fulvivirga maritima TaxID=2904247 RepID=UPI001F3B876A|nr:carboxypeptidase-like regulatory domain-containing protein [Fulvivirga maritima]UII25852.1 carboxypeptidase-like regulatory domain-containing protein [Fulvivirga maritima]